MKQEMLINVAQPEECRIAVVEDGVLEELYIERTSQESFVGNIYKGVVVNLEPSIQAAFVDFGVGKNGFLHISDVEPQYFRQGGYDPREALGSDGGGHGDGGRGDAPRGSRGGGRGHSGRGERARGGEEGGERPPQHAAQHDRPREDTDFEDDNGDNGGDGGPPRRGPRRSFSSRPRIKPPIQDIFRRGDEVLVQVIKEGIGAKGPTLSTYMSIPGRYLVLMPALGRVGVSRKIEDEIVRRKLRDALLDLHPPKGVGFIVRTAGADRSRRDLSRDLAYLVRLWKVIVRRLKNTNGPSPIYEESDMIIRTIRDIFTANVDAIYIDEPDAYERAKEFLQLVMPRHVNRLHLYEGKDPLFHKYNLDEEIAKVHRRVVPLKQGGSIVIDQTEALVAIDVNSGTFRRDDNAEETAFQINLIAAKEIARQLRLRDLGGVVVNDFIDMRREKHRRGVEHALRDAMRRDRARTKILRTSPFGLVEMTRQRIRPSLKRSVFRECPGCAGTGLVKTPESMALEVIRLLMLARQLDKVSRVTVHVESEVASYLNNKKRRDLSLIEEQGSLTIRVEGREGVMPELLEIECEDSRGNPVPFTHRI